MPHPLFSLSNLLTRRARHRSTRKAMEETQADPHLARDVGLPYRPQVKPGADLW